MYYPFVIIDVIWKYFIQSVNCLFLLVSFGAQKILLLIESNLAIFVVIVSCASGVISKKPSMSCFLLRVLLFQVLQ